MDTAVAYGVDPRLAFEVASRESRFNQAAVSSRGAIGVMQLMPGTAAELGVDPYDLEENIKGGVLYLRQQLARFGDTAQALAAYNWGPGRVARAIASKGAAWLTAVPGETRAYVAGILGNLQQWATTVHVPVWVPDTGQVTQAITAALPPREAWPMLALLGAGALTLWLVLDEI